MFSGFCSILKLLLGKWYVAPIPAVTLSTNWYWYPQRLGHFAIPCHNIHTLVSIPSTPSFSVSEG